MNEQLGSHEKIKGVLMIKEPWSIDNGVLTLPKNQTPCIRTEIS